MSLVSSKSQPFLSGLPSQYPSSPLLTEIRPGHIRLPYLQSFDEFKARLNPLQHPKSLEGLNSPSQLSGLLSPQYRSIHNAASPNHLPPLARGLQSPLMDGTGTDNTSSDLDWSVTKDKKIKSPRKLKNLTSNMTQKEDKIKRINLDSLMELPSPKGRFGLSERVERDAELSTEHQIYHKGSQTGRLKESSHEENLVLKHKKNLGSSLTPQAEDIELNHKTNTKLVPLPLENADTSTKRKSIVKKKLDTVISKVISRTKRRIASQIPNKHDEDFESPTEQPKTERIEQKAKTFKCRLSRIPEKFEEEGLLRKGNPFSNGKSLKLKNLDELMADLDELDGFRRRTIKAIENR